MAIALNDAIRSKVVDRVTAYLSGTGGTSGNTGMMRVYAGSQPADGGGSTSGSTMLVQITGLSWNAATNGTAGIAASKAGTAGEAGEAGWARLSSSDGTSYVIDGDVVSDFIIDTTTVEESAVVTVTEANIVQPAA